MDTSFSPFGKDLFGDVIQPEKRSPIAERFIVPPFSVLSAREGEWQARKEAWLGIGIQSEVGRDDNLLYDVAGTVAAEKWDGGLACLKEGTSVFDPVLCELAYTWFTCPGHQIVDPFAGGSVRGVVASRLGRKYWGSDLRQEQIEANNEQAAKLCNGSRPEYVCGDSSDTLLDGPRCDFVFSCPPYGDLEVYSKDNRDLSNMEWPAFLKAYTNIIDLSCRLLKPNRFACFVVGDFRDAKGHCRNFVGETISAFKTAGLEFYNEAILVTSIGSAAARVTRQFGAGRKFCKVHQNVLVFCKGDWEKASQRLNEQPDPNASWQYK